MAKGGRYGASRRCGEVEDMAVVSVEGVRGCEITDGPDLSRNLPVENVGGT